MFVQILPFAPALPWCYASIAFHFTKQNGKHLPLLLLSCALTCHRISKPAVISAERSKCRMTSKNIIFDQWVHFSDQVEAHREEKSHIGSVFLLQCWAQGWVAKLWKTNKQKVGVLSVLGLYSSVLSTSPLQRIRMLLIWTAVMTLAKGRGVVYSKCKYSLALTNVYPLCCIFLFQNKEIEELTKICDELIAKMGKS